MENLIIKEIVVHEDCAEQLRKILNPGRYVLSSEKYKDFFIDRVNVSAIVGMNGCGKSSIVEILFRMMNNLAAVMLKDFDRPAAECMQFIPGLVADLHYVLNDVEGELECSNNMVVLKYGQEQFEWKLNEIVCKRTDGQGKVLNENPYQTAMAVARNFFYLIATNYSMQSYVANDYRSEHGYRWQKPGDNNEKPWKLDIINSWINGIFHKNDGYMCPIVLNPYRDEGTIDMNKEARLTTNRLCALLLHTRGEDFQLVEGYRLSNIYYTFNNTFLYSKFDKAVLNAVEGNDITEKLLNVYAQPNSFARCILDGYGLTLRSGMTIEEKTLRLYLVYKTFSVAKKYPQYLRYRIIGDINNTFRTSTQKLDLQYSDELAKALHNDSSHISLKIQQTITLIKVLNTLEPKPNLEKKIDYDSMMGLLNIHPVCHTLQDQLAVLPPPIFLPSICLIKEETYQDMLKSRVSAEEKKAMIREKEIPMGRLSSGERQFIYTTSTFIYHSFNLLSVPESIRLAYRNICLVLEEVEICFHPEYQRTFVKKLLNLIERTKLNRSFSYDIIIVTHSPFVLSDIPKENTLFLKEGKNVTETMSLNTFGANINELLAESFFLSGGFMGEFAKTKIESLVEYLQNGENQGDTAWNRESAIETINAIGDEVIRLQLRSMFAKRFESDQDSYADWLRNECNRLGI